MLHRQSFVMANHPPLLEDPVHSSQPANSSPPKSPKSPKKSLTPHQSPVPKRHAPPPPTSPEKVNESTKKGSPRRRGSTDDVNRRSQNNRIQDNRYSLHANAIEEYQYEGKTLQSYGSLTRRTAPAPPNRQTEERNVGTTDQQFYSLQRSPPKSRQPSSTLSPASSSYSPKHRASDQPPIRQPSSPEKPTRSSSQDLQQQAVWQSSSPEKNATSLSHDLQHHDTQQSSSPGKTHRSSSQDIPHHSTRQPNSPDKNTRSLSHNLPPRQCSLSVGNIQGGSNYDQNKSLSSSPSSCGSSKERETQATLAPPMVTPTISTLAPHPPPLPTSFSAKDGAELVETVRKVAGVTHHKAQQAVGGVLQFLKKQVPQCEGMVNGLFAALEQAMVRKNAKPKRGPWGSTVLRVSGRLEKFTEGLCYNNYMNATCFGKALGGFGVNA